MVASEVQSKVRTGRLEKHGLDQHADGLSRESREITLNGNASKGQFLDRTSDSIDRGPAVIGRDRLRIP